MGAKHRDAAAIAGFAESSKVYVSVLKNSPEGKEYMAELAGQLDEKAIDTSSLLTALGREAIARLAGLMRHSQNENIILRSAQDLADRAPDTQKIQRHQIESFTISGADAKAMAAAMVESAKLKERYVEAAQGDFIKVPLEIRESSDV